MHRLNTDYAQTVMSGPRNCDELVQTEIEKLTKSLIEKIEKNNDALLRIDAFNDEKDSMIEYMKSQLSEHESKIGKIQKA